MREEASSVPSERGKKVPIKSGQEIEGYTPADWIGAPSITAAEAELKKRLRVQRNPWGTEVERLPGYCGCSNCTVETFETLRQVSERGRRLTCPNTPPNEYCEKHSSFYHFMDEGCEICRSDEEVNENLGYDFVSFFGMVRGTTNMMQLNVCRQCMKILRKGEKHDHA